MATQHLQSNCLIRFKHYTQEVRINLPVLVKDLIKNNAQVQIIDEIVNNIDMNIFNIYYSGNGCPPYHPVMLTKVWLYGFCQGIYTSRKLAKKLSEDLCFIWLSGNQHPCFKTLSSFRSGALSELIDKVFEEVLFYLIDKGYINVNDLYIDGSKWEANANKHKITWSKNTARYKSKVLERIADFLSEVKNLQAQENAHYGNKGLAEQASEEEIQIVLNSKDLTAHIEAVNQLASAEVQKGKARKLRSISDKLVKEKANLEKYENQEKLLSGRNSFSKTDTDATGLRMKDQQLKPGYNTQITTSNQYVIYASVHHNASDTPTFVTHLEGLKSQLKDIIEAPWHPDFTMDAAYGSEENYTLIEQEGGRAFVKHFLWYRQSTGVLAKDIYHAANWKFNVIEDYFSCPEGKKLLFLKEYVETTQTGYDRQIRIYECESCDNCPVFKLCRGENTKEGTHRRLHRSLKYEYYKKQAQELLASEEGLEKRSQRSVDVETPFANIKHNMGHRRFILRGLTEVSTEFKMLAIAHNIIKIECEQTGKWKEYYAQRNKKSESRRSKRA
jgi:transposase